MNNYKHDLKEIQYHLRLAAGVARGALAVLINTAPQHAIKFEPSMLVQEGGSDFFVYGVTTWQHKLVLIPWDENTPLEKCREVADLSTDNQLRLLRRCGQELGLEKT